MWEMIPKYWKLSTFGGSYDIIVTEVSMKFFSVGFKSTEPIFFGKSKEASEFGD
jgi:hypothetical protein